MVEKWDSLWWKAAVILLATTLMSTPLHAHDRRNCSAVSAWWDLGGSSSHWTPQSAAPADRADGEALLGGEGAKVEQPESNSSPGSAMQSFLQRLGPKEVPAGEGLCGELSDSQVASNDTEARARSHFRLGQDDIRFLIGTLKFPLWAARILLTLTAIPAGILFLCKELNMGICHADKDLHYKVAIVTGGTRGLGYEVAKFLASRYALVIIASRNADAGAAAASQIREETGNRFVRYLHLDLASFASVEKFAAEFNENNDVLDILVNNAGILRDRSKSTVDKLHPVVQTNYLGHFFLTNLLVKPLMKSENPKVINVSTSPGFHLLSELEERGLDSFGTCLQYDCELAPFVESKFATTLVTKEMVRRWRGRRKLSCYAVSPGLVRTSTLEKLLSYSLYVIGKNRWQGIQTILHCIMEDNLENGKLYSNCRVIRETGPLNIFKAADTIVLGKLLWKKSLDLVGHASIRNIETETAFAMGN